MEITKLTGKVLCPVVFACFATFAHADEMNAGKIHFTGTIIEPSCEISGDDGKDNNVPLGTYPTSLFTATGVESTLIPFTITLTKCPVATDGLPSVQLTFNGTTVTGDPTLLQVSKITTDGSTAATNIGIAVSPSGDSTSLIKFDGSEDQVSILLPISPGTDVSADFDARYKAFATPVTAGPADADLTVNILYR
ncbi:fimbrial protein [Atlantibacter hermannii]|uniref:fimbrial protein n=1 Tax=Atlantibacter hermannii TaxID=565 RepID=UPI0034D4158A